MKIDETFYPMLLLDIDAEDKITMTFRTPSVQLFRGIQVKNLEGPLRSLMERLGDDLDIHLTHMEEMKPKGSIGKH